MAEETGLAFSGGGIRSAALCSGVLRRLLQRKAKIDYLSCVSGGGYTGTAYLDWKYRHGKKDDAKWHQEFFDHMRERAGLMCNWQKPLQGILQTIIILSLILFTGVIMPTIVWGSYVLPLAYIIDLTYGDLLRAKDECSDGSDLPNINGMTSIQGNSASSLTQCKLQIGPAAHRRITLFCTFLVLFVLFYLFSKKTERFHSILYFISVFCGLGFAFTFNPYFIFSYLDGLIFWLKFLIFAFSVWIWIFFPVLRHRSSFFVIVYLYSYVIYWKVYKVSLLSVQYSDDLFYRLLFASGIVQWIIPMLGALQQRLIYVFNRWRLQKAFYTKASVGKTGCLGIGIEDIFLVTCSSDTKHKRLKDDEPGPLNLGDLEGLKPEYLSNIVVNEWKTNKSDKDAYELLIMSPTGIERLDQSKQQFEDKLSPSDIDLSVAMATSAAAVASNMGSYDKSTEGFKQLQTVLGLGMGSSLVSDLHSLQRESCLFKILPLIVEVIRVLPLVTFPVVYFAGGDEKWVEIGVAIFWVLLLVLSIISVQRTGDENPGHVEKITRWFIVHVGFVRFLRQMFFVTNVGPSPPAILRLSDGGHIENLAILPLLKKRLKKIVVVDGGHKESDQEWGDSLLTALSLARQKLDCSFIGLDGRDVIEDLKNKFVNKPLGHQPRSYRFKVHYFENETVLEEARKVGEGEILLVSPRHPDKGLKRQECVTWKESLRDVDLEAGEWGLGPQLDAKEADKLTFCCCECCHSDSLQRLSKMMCGTFPQHTTANQFFTPRMFAAYHSEGYNACVEAEAAEFLGTARQGEIKGQNQFGMGV